MGRVLRVDFGRGYDWQPKSVAMTISPELAETYPTSLFMVGPEVIHLTDGRVLHVPPKTPGANGCPELLTGANRLAVTGLPAPDGLRDSNLPINSRRHACIVIAAVAKHDVVRRFAVLPDQHGLANVGELVAARGTAYLTRSGYVFRLGSHVDGSCAPPKVTLRKLLRGETFHQALVDPKTRTIVRIDCLYRM
jgi:hypothetical protein